MIKHFLIVTTFMVTCYYVIAGNYSEDNLSNDIASSAIRNSIKFNYDLINDNNDNESANLSDDFNMPVLRSHWNSGLNKNEWTLKERPGYLRIKAQQSNTIEEVKPEKTFTQKVKRNSYGEAVSLVDLSSLTDDTHAGLYFRSSEMYYIGIESRNGKNSVIVSIAGDKQEGPALINNTVLFRVKIAAVKAWFEYSVDGTTFIKFGSEFQINTLRGENDVIGLYCFGDNSECGSVDIDWFYFNAMVDETIRFAEKENKISFPEI